MGEISRAINQYLPGSTLGEAASPKMQKEKAPKDLPSLAAIEKTLNRTIRSIDHTLARLKTSERRLAALSRIDTSAIGLLALEVFGSADKAYA